MSSQMQLYIHEIGIKIDNILKERNPNIQDLKYISNLIAENNMVYCYPYQMKEFINKYAKFCEKAIDSEEK